MRQITGLAIPVVLVSLFAAALSGCASTTTQPNTVEYPDGTYKMYGDGTTTPYYWVWVPKGTSAPVLPSPPALPTNQPAVVVQSGVAGVAPTVVAPPVQTVAAANGRYQLYGNGTTQPYYWAWIPNGVTVPAPPPLPLR